MAESIIQRKGSKECLLCRMEAESTGYYGELPHTGLHRHHLIHGTGNRKKAEHYGLWAYVCVRRHHEYGPEAPHANAEVDRRLKQLAQERFEERYSRELWMQEFGKNYLDTGKEDKKGPEGSRGIEGFIRMDDPLEWPEGWEGEKYV